MFGDISKKRIWSWNSDNSKHDDENGLWFDVCLALKKKTFFPQNTFSLLEWDIIFLYFVQTF